MKRYTKDLGDFITSCAHLSLLEEGVYNRLLDIVYSSEKPLPEDIASVCRLCRARSSDECATVEVVLREFFVLGPTGWTQARADAEIARSQNRAAKCRENGKKGGRPKKRRAPAVVEPGPDMPEMGLASPAAEVPYVVDAPPKKRASNPPLTFGKWSDEVRSKGEKFISDYRPVWEYAEKVGLPNEFVMLAFQVFKDRYTNTEKGRRKPYKDWRLTFLNSIKADWFRIWRTDADGRYVLTSLGAQYDLEHRKAA